MPNDLDKPDGCNRCESCRDCTDFHLFPDCPGLADSDESPRDGQSDNSGPALPRRVLAWLGEHFPDMSADPSTAQGELAADMRAVIDGETG